MDDIKRKYIQNFIRNNEAVVISSECGEYPHVATVYYSEDKECKNLYFTSANHRDHSKHYNTKGPHAAGAIYYYDKNDLSIQEGIQFQGEVYRITSLKEALTNFAHYFNKIPFAKKFFKDPAHTVKDAADASMYRIELKRLKFFSHNVDMRVEDYTNW